MTSSNANDLEQVKSVYNVALAKLKRFETCQNELSQLTEVVKDAAATNRMGTEPEFRRFVNEEMGIGLMQKLAKCMSFD